MKRVLTAVVLIPLVLLVVFRAPLWLFALVVAGIVVLALHEYLNIAEAAGIKPFHQLTYLICILSVLRSALIAVSGDATIRLSPFTRPLDIVLGITLIIFGAALVFRKDLRNGLASVAASAFALTYIAGPLSLLIGLRRPFGKEAFVPFALFSTWAGDIAAYYVGRSFGKHKLAPIVSPGKTWEGAIASVIASVAAAIVFFHFVLSIDEWFQGRFDALAINSIRWLHVVCLGVLTNIAAQFGDLFESALKRGAGVKDSGTLLPGHGGLLDRIDALLFAIPMVWYYAAFIQPVMYK
jgi:phosphatidate cytidylyltransferase